MRGKFENLVQCVTTTAEESIKEAANEKNDEEILRQVRDVDLVAKELHYHNTCRRDYTRILSNAHPKGQPSATETQPDIHQEAFLYIYVSTLKTLSSDVVMLKESQCCGKNIFPIYKNITHMSIMIITRLKN